MYLLVGQLFFIVPLLCCENSVWLRINAIWSLPNTGDTHKNVYALQHKNKHTKKVGTVMWNTQFTAIFFYWFALECFRKNNWVERWFRCCTIVESSMHQTAWKLYFTLRVLQSTEMKWRTFSIMLWHDFFNISTPGWIRWVSSNVIHVLQCLLKALTFRDIYLRVGHSFQAHSYTHIHTQLYFDETVSLKFTLICCVFLLCFLSSTYSKVFFFSSSQTKKKLYFAVLWSFFLFRHVSLNAAN